MNLLLKINFYKSKRLVTLSYKPFIYYFVIVTFLRDLGESGFSPLATEVYSAKLCINIVNGKIEVA